MDEDCEMQSAHLERTTTSSFDKGKGREVDEQSADSWGNEWVRLESNDGFSYIVRRKVAETSGTVHNMLDPRSAFDEALTKTCNINERAIVTEKLVEYMCFKAHYQTVGPKEDIPVQEMQERIPPAIVLEVLLAADFQEM